MNALKLWWNSIAVREQRWISVAAWLVGLTLVWWLGLAPAIKTLRAAPEQHAAADAQLQAMRAQAAQAKDLRGQRAINYDEALRNLEGSVKKTLGTGANLAINDTRANLSLKNVNADALAVWLNQARIDARAVPSEARITRSTPAAASSTSTVTSWDGTIVLNLPPR
jgi:general secretion pathway protein M